MKALALSEIVILLAICLQSKNVVHTEENSSPNQKTDPKPLPSNTSNNDAVENPSLNKQTGPKPLPSNTSNNDAVENPSLNKQTGPKPLPSNTSNNDAVENPNLNKLTDLQESKHNTVENDASSTTSISLATNESAVINHRTDRNGATFNNFDEMNEISELSNNQNAASVKNKSFKSVAKEIAYNPYNNSFLLTKLLNFSCDKYDVSPIGKPVDLASFIQNLVFAPKLVEFLGKVTNFSNIHAFGIPPSHSAHTYYNNFTCTPQHVGIMLDVIPENMAFEVDYAVLNNETKVILSNGTFTFHQIEARLSYESRNISELRSNGSILKNSSDLISANEQVEFTELRDNRGDLLASSSHMINSVKIHLLENLNASLVSKRIDQFVAAFPFLSNCSSAPSSAPQHNKGRNYYVIEEIVILGENTSASLQVGPIIIKGLDNFTRGSVVAIKRELRESSNHFHLSTQASRITGQCDWRLLNDNPRHSADNNSFTFIIERVKFSIGVDFTESWDMNYLDIRLDKISIHKLDKNSPKMHGFIKMALEDFVQSAIKNSLMNLFNRHFPKLIAPKTSTTTDAPTKSTQQTVATRQVVNWTPFHPSDKIYATANNENEDHLPFPTRKVFTSCKDDRKWWQKLFYRNKCKRNILKDD